MDITEEELIALRRERDELDAGLETCELEFKAFLKEIVSLGPALIARNYAPGSPTVRELIEKAEKLLSRWA